MQDWNWETIFYGHYSFSFNHCDVIGQQSNRWIEYDEKRKINAITPFMVIEVGIKQKLVCDFLLVINSNWHPISYRFGVIVACFTNFCIFEPPTPRLGTMYDVHLGLIGKRIVDFLLVLIVLFFARCYGWGTTGENISKIGDFAPTGSVWPKISGRRVAPTNHSSYHKTRVNDLSCHIRMRAQL